MVNGVRGIRKRNVKGRVLVGRLRTNMGGGNGVGCVQKVKR